MKHYIPENNVYVYFRYNTKKAVMVVINNNPKEQTISLNRFKESLKEFSSGKDILSNKMLDITKKEITVKGKTSLILELQ